MDIKERFEKIIKVVNSYKCKSGVEEKYVEHFRCQCEWFLEEIEKEEKEFKNNV